MTVTYQTVNVSQGGSGENLIINPCGAINQAGESDGVLAAGQYFRDGWKAGAAGAEVYVDADGFRLVSGSIVQVIENTFEVGARLRAAMDVISGNPAITINTQPEPFVVAAGTITLEIKGDNSKFTRVCASIGGELPAYHERCYQDELARCMRFYQLIPQLWHFAYADDTTSRDLISHLLPVPMATAPAVSCDNLSSNVGGLSGVSISSDGITLVTHTATYRTLTGVIRAGIPNVVLDARV